MADVMKSEIGLLDLKIEQIHGYVAHSVNYLYEEFGYNVDMDYWLVKPHPGTDMTLWVAELMWPAEELEILAIAEIDKPHWYKL